MSIENLVFEGGGVKGIAFCGAVKYLEENGIMPNVKRLIGSSAGAITAGALAVGYKSYEVEKILKETNFINFLDDSWGVIGDIYRFINEYGLYRGDIFYRWIGKFIKEKTNNENISFKQVFEKYGIDLVITGTNVDRQKAVYFNHTDYPNMPIRLAIRISMSIPYVFRSIYFDGDYYVDGGVLDNYPIWYFKDIEKTLGFKLVNDNEKRDDQIYHVDNRIRNIKGFSINLLNSILHQIERLHVKSNYWKHTITINSLGVKTMDFNLSDDKKCELIEEGYLTTQKFFQSSEKTSEQPELEPVVTEEEPEVKYDSFVEHSSVDEED